MKAFTLLSLVLLVSCSSGAQNKEVQTTKTMNSEVITLITPQETHATIYDAMKNRTSVRDYADEGLTLEQLSGVLWAANGQNRPDGKRTTPSSMGLYPVMVYVILPNGVYLYHTKEHNLILVKKGDHRQSVGTQDFVHTAPLNIMYVTDLEMFNARPMYETDEERLFISGVDAGGYCQSATIWASGNGMGSVTRGMTNGDTFLKAIDAPESYRIVIGQTIGIRK